MDRGPHLISFLPIHHLLGFGVEKTHPTHQGYKRHNYQTSTSNKVHTLQTREEKNTPQIGARKCYTDQSSVFFNSLSHFTKIHTSQRSLKKYAGSASWISNQPGNH
jgi:hypothetical protein